MRLPISLCPHTLPRPQVSGQTTDRLVHECEEDEAGGCGGAGGAAGGEEDGLGLGITGGWQAGRDSRMGLVRDCGSAWLVAHALRTFTYGLWACSALT